MRRLIWLVLATHPTVGCLGADPSDKVADTYTDTDTDADTDADTDTDTDTDTDADTADSGMPPVDGDGDGYTVALGDCDDADPLVNPGATEICDDGWDNDCNGLADDDDPGLDPDSTTPWYRDGDGDGFGLETDHVLSCEAPSGTVAATGAGFDCDDEDPAFHPGADEDDCTDPADYNCDGAVGYADMDGDGWPACEDCDDTSDAVNPDAVEVCDDGLDNDCNDLADDEDPGLDLATATTWHRDGDEDGYGLEDDSVVFCLAPSGYVAASEAGFDCDDEDAAFHPGAVEDDCTDPADYNCDGSVGYADEDGDDWAACEDCDDTNPDAHPDAAEVCDGADNDCDTEIDEDSAVDALTWYIDYDLDEYGSDRFTVYSCTAVDGYTLDSTDCDDLDPDIHPGAPEVCDEADADEDCDGAADDADEDGAMGKIRYYVDGDGDTFGAADDAGVEYCDPPAGLVTDHTDCDDTDGDAGSSLDDGDCDGFSTSIDCNDADPAIYPGATEAWYDGVDSDCDEASDYDADSDGHDHVDHGGGDCNDTDPDIHPDAAETWYDGVDGNCDGLSDHDADADGHDHADHGGDDCNDEDESIHPEASDTWYDGVDSDCDDANDYDADADGHDHDAFGGDDCNDADRDIHPDAAETWYDGVDSDCDEASDYDADADGHDHTEHGGDDCNDADRDIHPDAAETWYDGIDGNCDGLSDYDADADGHDHPDHGGDDCDDADRDIHPDAAETWYDDIDGNCDGLSDYDADYDGHLHSSYGGDDCDDTVASTHPGATETWYDGTDSDCDGASDYDADGDGYIHSSFGGDDCDDDCATCYPGSTYSTESPDGRNQDCDLSVDELDHPARTRVCNESTGSGAHGGRVRADMEGGGLQRACEAYCGHDAYAISGCGTGGGCFPEMWSEYNFGTCTPSGGYTSCPNGGMDWSCSFSCICRDVYR